MGEEEVNMEEKFTDVKQVVDNMLLIKKEIKRAKKLKNKFKTSSNKAEQKNLTDAIDYSLNNVEDKISLVKNEIAKMKFDIEKNIDAGRLELLKNNYTFQDSKLRFKNTVIRVIRCGLLNSVKEIFKLRIGMKSLIREKLKTELSLIQSKYDKNQIEIIVNNNPEVF
jgi:hypothetical protein